MTLRARVALVLLALLASPAAAAHATLVLGEVTTTPDPPRPGAPFLLRVTLHDPSQAPIEDAVVRVELRPAPADPDADAEASPAEIELGLAETSAAVYEGELVVDRAGEYALLLRDSTFEWEEATATVLLEIGGRPVGSVPFILPPTAMGPRSIWTWVIWLVGVPIVAGLVVTVLVLTSGRSDDAPEA